jgi:hypothetical protein
MLTKKLIVYIAGPISGVENGNKEAFLRAEQLFKQLGYIVLNPHSPPIRYFREG